jgi:hypothetical protein
MYCPMQLDCKVMTGVIHNCPNLSECLRNSPLRRVEALRLYFQNLGVQPESTQSSFYVDVCSSVPLASPYLTAFTYNRDSQSRDRILFGSEIDWEQQFGGIKRFEGIALSQLEQIVECGFANPQDQHNFAPSIAALIEFAQEWISSGLIIGFEGYAVHPLRDDYRVSIDGLRIQRPCSDEAVSAFRELARHADELMIESGDLHAWWD